MDKIKDDRYYSDKLMRDLLFIRDHMSDMTYEVFSGDEVLQDSMMFRLIQISENARKLSDQFRADTSTIPWGDVFGLRNRIVHEYGGLDLQIVYDTLVSDIPELIQVFSSEI